MGVTWNNCNTSLQVYFIQSTVLLLILLATCANTLPINLKERGLVENEMETLSDLKLKNALISEKQRTMLKSFKRLLLQRGLHKEEDYASGMLPDDMSFQKYFLRGHSFLKNKIDRLVQDYRRRFEWYRNSRVLKREAEEGSEVEETFSPSHRSERSESISPSRFTGRRHIRHSRRRFREKSERSGWGGGYG